MGRLSDRSDFERREIVRGYLLEQIGRIAEALSNLTTNALTYGDATQPVRITADGRGDEVLLSVHNEGPPIPENFLPVLFQPFTRGTSDVVSHTVSAWGCSSSTPAARAGYAS